MDKMTILSEVEKSTRLKWRIFLLFLVIPVVVVSSAFELLVAIITEKNAMAYAMVVVRVFVRLLESYILYYYAYKKSGTRLLTWVMIVSPLIAFTVIAGIFSTIPLVHYLFAMIFSAIFVCWYCYSFQLRKINKKLQFQVVDTPELEKA